MRYHTLQEAYEGTRHYLRYDGEVIATKSSKGDSRAIELLNQSITIDDVCQINIYNPKRKFNVRYALLEFMWYLSLDPKVRNIGKAASTWKILLMSMVLYIVIMAVVFIGAGIELLMSW